MIGGQPTDYLESSLPGPDAPFSSAEGSVLSAQAWVRHPAGKGEARAGQLPEGRSRDEAVRWGGAGTVRQPVSSQQQQRQMVKEALASITGRRPHSSDSDTLAEEGGCYEGRGGRPTPEAAVCVLSALESPLPWL